MTSRDFCYWLQGYLEITNHGQVDMHPLTSAQATCIQKHLALVFKHEIDPSMGNEQAQEDLNKIHNQPKPHGPIGGASPGGTLYRC